MRMDIDVSRYLPKKKGPPHEKAAIVDLFLDFVGGATKDYPYTFWLRQVGRVKYPDAIEIVKSLETIPLEYNKAGAVINKLKKFNAKRQPTKN